MRSCESRWREIQSNRPASPVWRDRVPREAIAPPAQARRSHPSPLASRPRHLVGDEAMPRDGRQTQQTVRCSRRNARGSRGPGRTTLSSANHSPASSAARASWWPQSERSPASALTSPALAVRPRDRPAAHTSGPSAGASPNLLVAESRAQTEALRIAPPRRHDLGTCGPAFGEREGDPPCSLPVSLSSGREHRSPRAASGREGQLDRECQNGEEENSWAGADQPAVRDRTFFKARAVPAAGPLPSVLVTVEEAPNLGDGAWI